MIEFPQNFASKYSCVDSIKAVCSLTRNKLYLLLLTVAFNRQKLKTFHLSYSTIIFKAIFYLEFNSINHWNIEIRKLIFIVRVHTALCIDAGPANYSSACSVKSIIGVLCEKKPFYTWSIHICSVLKYIFNFDP